MIGQTVLPPSKGTSVFESRFRTCSKHGDLLACFVDGIYSSFTLPCKIDWNFTGQTRHLKIWEKHGITSKGGCIDQWIDGYPPKKKDSLTAAATNVTRDWERNGRTCSAPRPAAPPAEQRQGEPRPPVPEGVAVQKGSRKPTPGRHQAMPATQPPAAQPADGPGPPTWERDAGSTLAQNNLYEFWCGMHPTCKNNPVIPDRNGSVNWPEKFRKVLQCQMKFGNGRHAGSWLSRWPFENWYWNCRYAGLIRPSIPWLW